MATFGILLAMAGDVSFFLFWGWEVVWVSEKYETIWGCLDDGMVDVWVAMMLLGFLCFFLLAFSLLCWEICRKGN